jgi:heat shock protein HtpX
MANLYSHKDSNIRKTWLLITVFLVLVIGLGWLISYYLQSVEVLYFAVGLALIMNVAAYWNSDKIALSMSGAKPVKREDNLYLYRIVENLCITAGLPVPRIFLINSPQINAFATGRDPNHAVICVTTGLVEKLNRTELEGVLAHELSHIGNRDILISTIAVVLVGFISILADIFLRSMFFGGGRRRDSEGGGQIQAIMMIVGITLSILAPISATLIQLAISRKREYLADASGALLTRYPKGLADALRKIKSDTSELKTASNANAHMYISNPFKKKQWLASLFVSHPPVEDRIKKLESM